MSHQDLKHILTSSTRWKSRAGVSPETTEATPMLRVSRFPSGRRLRAEFAATFTVRPSPARSAIEASPFLRALSPVTA